MTTRRPQCLAERAEVLPAGRVRLSGTATGGAPVALLARLRGQADERRSPVTSSATGGWSAEITLPPPRERLEVWDLYVQAQTGPTDTGAEVRVQAGRGAADSPALVEGQEATYRLRPHATVRGALSIEAARQARHAEVQSLAVDGSTLQVRATTPAARLGQPAGEGRGTLVAQVRGGERAVRVPVELPGGVLDARLDLADLLPGAGEDDEVWDLSLAGDPGGAQLRLGRQLDEGPDPRDARYPTVQLGPPGQQRWLDAAFTRRGHLVVRSVPAQEAADGAADEDEGAGSRQPAAGPGGLLRRPLPRRLLAALLRSLARGGPQARRPLPADGPPPVTILLGNAYGMGGTIRTVLNLAAQLSATRDVQVLSVVRRRSRASLEVPPGVQVRALSDETLRQKGITGRLRTLLRAQPSVLWHDQDWALPLSSLWTDLVLVRTLRSLPPGVVIGTRPALNLLLAQAAPARLVTVGQEHMNLHAHRPRLAADLRRHYPRLDALAVLTSADERDYGALLSSAGTRVVRIPNALTELPGGLSTLEEKVVVAAGRLTGQKGFDRLLPAFAQVVRAHPDWSLRIFGEGHHDRRLRRQAAELGLSGSVHFLGTSRQFGGELARSSVFALSSRYEGFGMVLIEAMSKGLAVVSFDCPNGPGDVLTSGSDGLLVPEGDVDALAAALLRVIEDEPLRRALGQAAVHSAARYDARIIGAAWSGLLEELVGSRRALPADR